MPDDLQIDAPMATGAGATGPACVGNSDALAEPVAPRGRVPAWLKRLAPLVILGYLGVVLSMVFLEKSLLFFPAKYPDGYWNPPGLEFEDAQFTAADGVKVHGWYLPCERPRAVILFAHGNAGNITHRASILWSLRNDLHCSVLAFDYRGYGKSEGSPDEQGLLADARAGRAWLAQRAGIAERDIVLMGESLGGGVMVDLAANDGARGLILEGTFTSLPDVAARHFPWLPVRLLMRTRLDSRSIIADYHGPLFQAHGDADRIVPFDVARQLFDAANEPKQFMTMHGHDHNDMLPGQLFTALDGFLEALPK